MIVSRFESLCIRVLLGAIIDAARRQVIDPDDPRVIEIGTWLARAGVTLDAQIEIDEGDPIRCL